MDANVIFELKTIERQFVWIFLKFTRMSHHLFCWYFLGYKLSGRSETASSISAACWEQPKASAFLSVQMTLIEAYLLISGQWSDNRLINHSMNCRVFQTFLLIFIPPFTIRYIEQIESCRRPFVQFAKEEWTTNFENIQIKAIWSVLNGPDRFPKSSLVKIRLRLHSISRTQARDLQKKSFEHFLQTGHSLELDPISISH